MTDLETDQKIVDEFEENGQGLRSYGRQHVILAARRPIGKVADAFFQAKAPLAKDLSQIKREFSVDEVSVYVARQTEYPAHFIPLR